MCERRSPMGGGELERSRRRWDVWMSCGFFQRRNIRGTWCRRQPLVYQSATTWLSRLLPLATMLLPSRYETRRDGKTLRLSLGGRWVLAEASFGSTGACTSSAPKAASGSRSIARPSNGWTRPAPGWCCARDASSKTAISPWRWSACRRSSGPWSIPWTMAARRRRSRSTSTTRCRASWSGSAARSSPWGIGPSSCSEFFGGVSPMRRSRPSCSRAGCASRR